MSRQFGLIGFPISHSFSGRYFKDKFKKENFPDCHYDLFPLPHIQEFDALLKNNRDLEGLNVTIPYKIAILPFLHELSAEAKAIGAVNCIKLKNGFLTGYNTDAEAFIAILKSYKRPAQNKAIVFGSGGAAKAVCFALQTLEIEFILVARSPHTNFVSSITYKELMPGRFESHPLVINCTPVGMASILERELPIPYEGIGLQNTFIDLIYNPPQTVMMKKMMDLGAEVHNGYEMLCLQAEISWKIWNGIKGEEKPRIM